jgi:ankyrin repeat protein
MINVVKWLVERGADVDKQNNDNKSTPLHVAAYYSHKPIVEYLLKVGPRTNLINIYNCTAEMESPDAITPLIQNYDKTPISFVANGHSEKFNLTQFAQIAPNELDQNYLHFASKSGHIELVKYLCKKSPELAKKANKIKCTPLHYACAIGHLEIVKVLLETDACDLLAIDYWGYNCLQEAENFKRQNVVNYLEPRFQEITKPGKNDHSKAVEGDCDYFMNLITTKNATFDVDSVDQNGKTYLHLAAKFGHIKLAKLLIPLTKTNVVDESGSTPLHTAVFYGRHELIHDMLQAGHSPYIMNKKMETAISTNYNSNASVETKEKIKRIFDEFDCAPSYEADASQIIQIRIVELDDKQNIVQEKLLYVNSEDSIKSFVKKIEEVEMGTWPYFKLGFSGKLVVYHSMDMKMKFGMLLRDILPIGKTFQENSLVFQIVKNSIFPNVVCQKKIRNDIDDSSVAFARLVGSSEEKFELSFPHKTSYKSESGNLDFFYNHNETEEFRLSHSKVESDQKIKKALDNMNVKELFFLSSTNHTKLCVFVPQTQKLYVRNSLNGIWFSMPTQKNNAGKDYATLYPNCLYCLLQMQSIIPNYLEITGENTTELFTQKNDFPKGTATLEFFIPSTSVDWKKAWYASPVEHVQQLLNSGLVPQGAISSTGLILKQDGKTEQLIIIVSPSFSHAIKNARFSPFIFNAKKCICVFECRVQKTTDFENSFITVQSADDMLIQALHIIPV